MSERSFYRAVREGDLAVSKAANGRVVVSRDEILRYWERQENDAEAERVKRQKERLKAKREAELRSSREQSVA